MDAACPWGQCAAGLPTDDKGLEVIASPFPPLPTVGPGRRGYDINPMLGLGGDQEVWIA